MHVMQLLLVIHVHLKDTLSGLKLFLAAKSHLKVIKNAFYFTLKAIFVLKIFKFLSTFRSCRKTT